MYTEQWPLSGRRRVLSEKDVVHLAGEYKADWPWLLQLALLGEFIHIPEPLIRKI